jgi:hypothetical protein
VPHPHDQQHGGQREQREAQRAMPRALLDEREEDAHDRRARQDDAQRIERLALALGRGRRRQRR